MKNRKKKGIFNFFGVVQTAGLQHVYISTSGRKEGRRKERNKKETRKKQERNKKERNNAMYRRLASKISVLLLTLRFKRKSMTKRQCSSRLQKLKHFLSDLNMKL